MLGLRAVALGEVLVGHRRRCRIRCVRRGSVLSGVRRRHEPWRREAGRHGPVARAHGGVAPELWGPRRNKLHQAGVLTRLGDEELRRGELCAGADVYVLERGVL